MSAKVKELRRRTKLSQAKFAEYYNIPLSTLRKWEQGNAEAAEYFVSLLAKQLTPQTESLKKIECRDDGVYYYDAIAKSLHDTLGNVIHIHEGLDGVKDENLPLYVKDLFESYYEAIEKFDSDCKYDKKEDFIWSETVHF